MDDLYIIVISFLISLGWALVGASSVGVRKLFFLFFFFFFLFLCAELKRNAITNVAVRDCRRLWP
jgi:hypothetical protein